jgi:hypothetical protein
MWKPCRKEVNKRATNEGGKESNRERKGGEKV